ncbi:hypothetical protein Sjap_007744 [Stephania japonica]|uniref:Uncharacterized protein n=1 Tax=Stephania japonica TaxID=461633 RepID=A0AAP0JP20_9MAGN
MFTSTKQIPTLAIQITLFPTSGFSMAIVLNHAVMDSRTTSLFISSWASISWLGSDGYKGLLPSYDRTLVKGPSGIKEYTVEEMVKFIRSKFMSEHDMNNWLSLAKSAAIPEDAVLTTFELSLADITKLKQMIMDALNKVNIISTGNETTPLLLSPSRFKVACAYTWLCLTKASMEVETTNDHNETTTIIVTVDYRARSNSPLPSILLGTCTVAANVIAKKSEIVGEDGIVAAVKKIRSENKGLAETTEKNLKRRVARMVYLSPDRFRVIAGST